MCYSPGNVTSQDQVGARRTLAAHRQTAQLALNQVSVPDSHPGLETDPILAEFT